MERFSSGGKILIISLFVLQIFSGYLSDQKVEMYRQEPLFLSSDNFWVDSVMKKLTIDQKIGQLLMVAAYSNRDKSHIAEIDNLIVKYGIGGLIFFQGGPVRQANMTNHFQSKSNVPLLIGMDAEWGLGMRLDSTISYPRQMMLGAIQDDDLIYKMGLDIGRQLGRIGVHINFAPVADINNNPENPVINYRSFGENPQLVSKKAEKYFLGLQDAGVISTAKHFPGHGDTNADSHYSLPVINNSFSHLDSVELSSFRHLIDKGIPAIMTAHLNVPSIDTSRNLASSLSPLIVDSLLKKTLGFKGLIITDALNMKGVSGYFKNGEAEVRAFKAGNDILLMPGDVQKTILEIKKEIKNGTITEKDINQRCRKVLQSKVWAGLRNIKPINTDSLYSYLNAPEYIMLKRQLIANSITVIKNENTVLPLFNLGEAKIASLAIGTGRPDEFSETLKLYTSLDAFYISKSEKPENYAAFGEKLSKYNTLILSIQETLQTPGSKYGITENTINFIKNLDFNGNVILTLFGNPYSLEYLQDFKNIDAVVVAYDNDNITKDITAQIIFSALPSKGILPVSINSEYLSGKSIQIDSIQRLSYGIPEEEGFDSDILSFIDTMVFKAINMKATPGCQVLVARNGRVIYNKAFGYHTYRNNVPVKKDDLYDIASITKITATIPALMKLRDEGKFDLKKNLSFYMHELAKTNKGNLQIEDLLAHQSGLLPWIPFYYKTLETFDINQQLLNNRMSEEYPFKIGDNAYANRNVKFVDSLFSESYSEKYPINVAKGIFLRSDFRDTIISNIINSEVKKKEYKYSDLGYYFIQKIIESITGTHLYPYVYDNFYSPMGAGTLGYLPLNRFPESRIVPTENDLFFRKQLIAGYVHDPGAAMLGGIAGHAGVFSCANDLAKMMQMYLNGGVYGGRKYLSDTVITKFTSRAFWNNGNRRGLGFDKPEPDPKKISPAAKSASLSSFGHSGFTGTFVWVDPQYDLIFVFLSNRVHPDQFNNRLSEMDVRTEIQETIYEAIKEKIYLAGKNER